MVDPNIEKRTASGIAVNLSSYLITGSLAVLGAQAVVVTFTLDKKEHLVAFGVVSVLSFVSLIGSVICGGKGIDELSKLGYQGKWAIATKAGMFNVQSILTLLGVFLLGVSTLLGDSKARTPDMASPASIGALSDAITRMQQEFQTLEQNQVADHHQVERLAKTLENQQRSGGRKPTRSSR